MITLPGRCFMTNLSSSAGIQPAANRVLSEICNISLDNVVFGFHTTFYKRGQYTDLLTGSDLHALIKNFLCQKLQFSPWKSNLKIVRNSQNLHDTKSEISWGNTDKEENSNVVLFQQLQCLEEPSNTFQYFVNFQQKEQGEHYRAHHESFVTVY